MVATIDKTPQPGMFKIPIRHFIKEDHKLVLLSHKLDWDKSKSELSIYYCQDNGRPNIPIRKMAGIIILKKMFNES